MMYSTGGSLVQLQFTLHIAPRLSSSLHASKRPLHSPFYTVLSKTLNCSRTSQVLPQGRNTKETLRMLMAGSLILKLERSGAPVAHTQKPRPSRTKGSQTRGPTLHTLICQDLQDDRKRNDLMQQGAAEIAVSERHVKNRMNVLQQWKAAKGNALALLKIWSKMYAPSTAKHKMGTLFAMKPHLKTDRSLNELVEKIKRNAHQGTLRKAIPITTRQMRKLLRLASPKIARTAWILWLSASRYGDLAHLSVCKLENGVVVMRWNFQKSDIYGKRRISKFLTVLTQQNVYAMTLQEGFCRYHELLNALKMVDPTLSTYSLRRGSATFLAELGFPMPTIGIMTAHTPSADPSINVRQYVDVTANQPESLLQREMSKRLAEGLLEKNLKVK